ncbi:hypothetical protein FB446DRAFT_699429 [Lentinula raphanica]|nr:hypothetical protein FB446DRAFT_699429 [Lentinula raphanica]
MGLYFGQYQAIAERKRFESILSSRHKHHRFIDIRDGFSSHTDADDIYKMKVIVGYRRYYVCGTYDQSSPDTNASLRSYGVNEEFKGDVALFFYSVYEPERFLECIPRCITILNHFDWQAFGDHILHDAFKDVHDVLKADRKADVKDTLPHKRQTFINFTKSGG